MSDAALKPPVFTTLILTLPTIEQARGNLRTAAEEYGKAVTAMAHANPDDEYVCASAAVRLDTAEQALYDAAHVMVNIAQRAAANFIAPLLQKETS